MRLKKFSLWLSVQPRGLIQNTTTFDFFHFQTTRMNAITMNKGIPHERVSNSNNYHKHNSQQCSYLDMRVKNHRWKTEEDP